MKLEPAVYTLSVFNKFKDRVVHGISQRSGGSSNGCYSSLNLGLHVGDNADAVVKNRTRFSKQMGTDLSRVVCCEQVHGTNIHVVTKKDMGSGAFTLDDTIKDTDGLVTNKKNIPLMLFFADCAPLLIYDPQHNAIGLAHAGWRGTVGNIAANTLQVMHDTYGTEPSDCIAAIGPCIGQCCYEIGDNVAEKFIGLFSSLSVPSSVLSQILLRRADKYHLSLYEANKELLLLQGVKMENIADEHCCTSCNVEKFYSYRAENGKTGRHAALIYLK